MPFRVMVGISIMLALAGKAMCDIAPPNMKLANAKGRFNNLGDFPEYDFYVADDPNNQFVHDPEQKNKFRGSKVELAEPEVKLSNHYTSGRQFLLAVPKSLLEGGKVKPTNDWFDGKTPGVLQAELTGAVTYIPESDHRPAYWTFYRVEIAPYPATSKPTLSVHIVDVDHPAPASVRWLVAGGVGAFAVVMILVLFWRLRKSAAPTQ